jgi:outer membrane receptor protein involved in Fe transport
MNNSVEFKQKRFTFGLSGQYVSRTYLDNTQRSNFTTPSYYIINSNIGYNGDFLSIFLNINNIMNQKYYLPGGVTPGVESPAYYVGALRNMFLTFRFKV